MPARHGRIAARAAVPPFRTVVSTSAGLAYAAISLLACIQVASYLAGDSAWIALLVAGLLALLAAFCFAELNALYPSAAAIRQYIRAAAVFAVAYLYVRTVVPRLKAAEEARRPPRLAADASIPTPTSQPEASAEER